MLQCTVTHPGELRIKLCMGKETLIEESPIARVMLKGSVNNINIVGLKPMHNLRHLRLQQTIAKNKAAVEYREGYSQCRETDTCEFHFFA